MRSNGRVTLRYASMPFSGFSPLARLRIFLFRLEDFVTAIYARVVSVGFFNC
jgi:hypothetical protein